MVAFEEGQEARLSSSRALDTAESDIVSRALDIAQVHEELVDPERGAFADGRQLGGLEVREAEGGEGAVFDCEGG